MLIPNVKQVNGIWSGNVTLDSWNNFFNKEMDIDLNIGGDKLIESLNSRHKFAYEYLVTNQEKLLQIILNALLVEYPIMQEEYGYETLYLDISTVDSDGQSKIVDLDKDFFEENYGATPTVLLVKDNKIVDSHVGYSEYDDYAKFLEKNGFSKK